MSANYFLVETGDEDLDRELRSVALLVQALGEIPLEGLADRLRTRIKRGTWDGIQEQKLEVLSAWLIGLRAWRSAVLSRLGFKNDRQRRAELSQDKITAAQLAAKYPEPAETKVVPVATWKSIQGLPIPKAIAKINQVISGSLHLTNIFREEVTDNDRLETGA